MKRLILILCLLVIACGADARMGVVGMGGGVAAVAASCPGSAVALIDASTGTDATYRIPESNGYTFVGQANFDPGGNWQICSVTLDLRSVTGSGGGFKVQICTYNSTTLNTPDSDCESDEVLITSGSGIPVSFTGLNCAVNSGTTYGIVATRTSGSDTVDFYSNTTDNGLSGFVGFYNSDRTLNWTNSPMDMSMIINGYTK